MVQVVAETAEIVAARERPGLVPGDHDDDIIVSTAIDGRAAYIVSGDKALLDLEIYDGIPILPAARFLADVLQDS